MKLLTPVSHLFNNITNAQKIIDNSNFLEARERTCQLNFPNTTHYHIDFDLNIGITEKQTEFLKKHVKPREEIRTLTFQAARDCKKIKIRDGVYFPDSEIIPLSDQVYNTKKSILEIQDIVGTDRKIGIENNNFYDSGAYDICTSIDYLFEIINLDNCHLLFDIAHALVTCANKNIPFSYYSEKLLETKKCLQMHICQPTYIFNEKGISAKDSHNLPSFELTELSISLCKKYGIKLLTIEYYRDTAKLVNFLKYLKNSIETYE